VELLVEALEAPEVRTEVLNVLGGDVYEHKQRRLQEAAEQEAARHRLAWERSDHIDD
jgi:hypothetical protein